MSATADSTTPLVGVAAADNTFVVPAVEMVAPLSTESSTAHGGYKVEPQAVFDRDILLRTYSISNLDTPLINRFTDFDPWYAYLSEPFIVEYLRAFGQVRCDLIITVRVIAPGSCYGVYNLQALCDGGSPVGERDGPPVDAYPNSTQDVHAFIDVALKNDIVMTLPWESELDSFPLMYLSPTNSPQCWRLLLWALAPIQSTVSDNVTGSIQVFARMGDRRLENLRYQSAVSRSGGAPPQKVSTMMGEISRGVSGLSGMFPTISPLATPVAMGLAAMSTFADMLGFTRDARPTLPTLVAPRLASSMAYVDGEDSSEIVALSVANTLSIDPAPGGGESIDPMSYASLFERWTIVETFLITDDSTGILRRFPVTPYHCNLILGVRYPTVAGWVGMPFSLWRGGMEYLVYIPSSSNLQGSLQVLWDPNPASGGTLLADPTHRLSNVVIDLKGTSRTHIGIDYSSFYPSLQSQVYTSGEPNSSFSGGNGALIFRLMSPLTAPKAGPVSVTVIVMARASQDMAFSSPSMQYSMNLVADRDLENLCYQSAVTPASHDDKMVIKLVDCPSNYPVEQVLWGENIRSVRALCQHFTPVFELSRYDDTNEFNAWPHFFPPPGTVPTNWAAVGTASNYVPFSYFGYYIAPFTGVRGSSRVKLISRVSNLMAAYNVPAGKYLDGGMSISAGALLGPTVFDVQRVGLDAVPEFQYPSYAANKYWLVRGTPNVSAVTSRARYDGIAPIDNTIPIAGILAYAGGPDITVTRFRRIPGLLMVP